MAGAVCGYALTFIYLTFLRFDTFEARALDLGNFDQAVWNTAHGRWFHLTNQPGIVNRLSLHVEPILIPISALYWIVSSPKTLLFVQAVVVAAGAIPLFFLTAKELGSRWLGLIFSLAFLLNPSMQAANWLEFHALTLAPTFLLATLYSLHARRWRLFALFAVLAASCKEEMGLLLFMIGIYACFYLGHRRAGTITMVGGLGWSLFAVLGIQQYFGDGNIHWNRYEHLGENPWQIVETVLLNPQAVWTQLNNANALLYLTRLLIPVALLGLFALDILFLALPSLAINLLADFPPMHEVDRLIYAAPIVPFALMAGLIASRRCLSLFGDSVSRVATKSILGVLILGCTLVNHFYFGYTPGSGHFKRLIETEHHRQADFIIRQIPREAKVSAQDRLNPHVSQRETVYIFPRIEDANTIFIDASGPPWPLHPVDLYRQINQLRDMGFGIAAGHHGYLLLSQSTTNQEIPQSFYDVWHESDSTNHIGMKSLDILFDDLMRLTGVKVETDPNHELVVKLTWQLLRPPKQIVDFYVAYLDRDGLPVHSTEFYPLPASLWYPTSLWQPENLSSGEGVTYLVQTLPWTLEQDQFTLVVGLYYTGRIVDGTEWAWHSQSWQEASRLPVTAMAKPYPLLDDQALVRLGGYVRDGDGRWIAQQQFGNYQTALGVTLDTHVKLSGVSIDSRRVEPGSNLTFTLQWQVAEPVEKDYSMFVHLVSDSGEIVAQLDRQPRDEAGILPMTSWVVEQPVSDTIELYVPDSTVPGRYNLRAGLYNWEDGQRLSVRGDSATGDSSIALGVIEVQP